MNSASKAQLHTYDVGAARDLRVLVVDHRGLRDRDEHRLRGAEGCAVIQAPMVE